MIGAKSASVNVLTNMMSGSVKLGAVGDGCLSITSTVFCKKFHRNSVEIKGTFGC